MKTRKKFTREFKISILRELENGKSAAQVSRENGIHPSMLSKWKLEYKEKSQTAFSGNGNINKLEAKLAESEDVQLSELAEADTTNGTGSIRHTAQILKR